jgi:DNA-binding transcriptional ArsR family regulator
MDANYYNHVYEGGFVMYPNEVALYTILGHAKKNDSEPWMDEKTYTDYKVTSASLDVYRALYQHRNTNATHKHFGKTWTSQRRLQLELSMSDKTLRSHLEVLGNAELIKVDRKYRNNRPFHVYTFPYPLSISEFKRKYPKACEEYEKKMRLLDKIREEERELTDDTDW